MVVDPQRTTILSTIAFKDRISFMKISLNDLYKKKELNQVSHFLQFMKKMEMEEIIESYRQLRDEEAPQRNNSYFVDTHNGISSSGSSSNRNEEHLALSLFNASRENKIFKLPDDRVLEFIDYQTPLKSKQNDKGIGKVDLFGLIDNKQPTIIELKIQSEKEGQADTPLRALLEGLAYCAIIEKNLQKITDEASNKFNKELNKKLTLIILAPDEYWKSYIKNKSAGDWFPEIKKISNTIEEKLNIEIILLAMIDSKFKMGLEGTPAKLVGKCDLVLVETMVLS